MYKFLLLSTVTLNCLQDNGTRIFVLLEEVISRFIDKLFKGYEVKSVTAFRITRNADLTIHEDEADDLLMKLKKN